MSRVYFVVYIVTMWVVPELYNCFCSVMHYYVFRLLFMAMKFNNDKTIVDSGTTDIFFPMEVFKEVKNIFTDYFKVSNHLHQCIYRLCLTA